MKQDQPRQLELRLFEGKSGYELLDMIAQANLQLDDIPLDQLDSMVVQLLTNVPSACWRSLTRKSA